MPRVLTHLRWNLSRGRRPAPERSLLQQQDREPQGPGLPQLAREMPGNRGRVLLALESLPPGSRASRRYRLGPYTDPGSLSAGC